MPSEPFRPSNPIAHRIRGHNQREGVPQTDAEFAKLARQWRAPEAHIRSAIEYFPELQQTGKRACAGLPCRLANGSAAEGETIACAGYCDHAPVTLDAAGAVESNAPGNQRSCFRSLAADSIFDPDPLQSPRDFQAAKAAGIYGDIDPDGPGRIWLERLRAAGFPAAEDWLQAAETESDLRFVIAHSHPGNAGAFADRVLMESNPHALIEALVMCGRAIGAAEAVVFVAAENPETFQILERAATEAAESGIFQDAFEIAVVSGFGAYVAGEETAMLNAIEGVRGEVRVRPPDPLKAGLFQRPTVIEPASIFMAAASLIRSGQDRDPGNRIISITSGFQKPGLVEIDRGTTLRNVIAEGGESEESLAAVLLGGPLGSLISPGEWDLKMNDAEFAQRNLSTGHWGLTPIPHEADFNLIAAALLEFAAAESCGKCAPCRLGPVAARNLLEAGQSKSHRFREILDLLEQGSLCEFGQRIPGPLRQLIQQFGDRLG